MIDEPQSQEDALRFYHTHRKGELVFDEHCRPFRYVVDPATGRLVAPVMVAMLTASQHVLCIPRDDEGEAMRVIVTPEEVKEHDLGALADRWRIYHGEPEDVRWAVLWVEFVKWGESVYDGELFMASNPLAADEPSICKYCNSEKERLKALCNAHAEVRMDAETQPVCVGVDSLGVHIRGAFEVLRVPFAKAIETADDVRTELDRLFAEVPS